MTDAAVLVSAASVAYDGRRVLTDVDVRVDVGEFLAVLGPNGSGKSTLVKAALGLAPLASGSVELFGTPLRRFRSWERIGYVPQRTGATSGVPATVQEVVASGRLARMHRLRRSSTADRSAVDDALETVGLSGRRRDSVPTLSGGQQQRVLIARALATEPDLLVLDEPTSGVDTENQQALAEAFGRLSERRVTVVLITHELGPVAQLVQRALVMSGGRVRSDGAPPAHDHLHEADPDHAHPTHPHQAPSAWGR